MLEVGIMLQSLVVRLTLAIISGPEFSAPRSASLVTAIMFHQLVESVSLRVQIATLLAEDGKYRVLKPALALMFVVTTPVGIAIGLAVFGPGESEGGACHLKLILLTGVMSALSAGMLIYATCVEMLAGDFVLDPHLRRSSVGRQALALRIIFIVSFWVCVYFQVGCALS
ncbi:uncharacterized protein LAESUDRAFT_667609 [Laetiporus sulphureus 93-53]|uniref:Zinc/iron permease n=1 Tax=Laetiporus sulphureus 93-53 TaxID=1314785 RepID=A0A165AVI1_9APHY|nr:uncharacterized protein LAESUDRAFT_667609 [Laetiporus sulphureus 93-53]KZS99745.1 hypothetical protein LAESUDRAFT_667609 [Laetiporus sulphureus 93-53]